MSWDFWSFDSDESFKINKIVWCKYLLIPMITKLLLNSTNVSIFLVN